MIPATDRPQLRLSRDRKISPYVVRARSGKSFRALPNAFGLPAGRAASCPGATRVCETVCYAGRLELAYTSLHRMLEHNLRCLRDCGDDVAEMVSILAPLVDEFVAECERAELRAGRPVPRWFRIHWDGDFYSLPYAQAWRQTVLRYPEVRFWAYTRSFRPALNVVPVLRGVPNLTVYLSVDVANYRDAQRVLAECPETLVSVLAPTVEAGKVLYRALTGRSAAACPEKVGKLPLVTARGEGACITCGLCLEGRKGVVFPAVHGQLKPG